MKKRKNERVAVHAELRKESQTFKGYLKYEVTVKNPDGSIEKVPAYGKGLQDALDRVVHDERVEKIEKRAKRIPEIVWVILWFGYILGWTMLTYEVSDYRKFDGLFFIGGIALITGVTVWAKSWFRRRNINK